MRLNKLLAGISGIQLIGDENTEIKGIEYSSNKIEKDYLFAALKGEKNDGFEFIEDARRRGASCILSERTPPSGFTLPWIQANDARETMAYCSANFFKHPSLQLKVIGITGTKGKTTCTYLLESILKIAGFHPGVIGTIAYRGPGFNFKAERTTPESPDLQKMMSTTLENGGTHCLLEVSSHSLILHRVTGIGFDIALFTNLSGEHLDYHKTLNDYFEAKKRLFQTGPKNRISIINTDDPWGIKLKEQLSSGIISYGIKNPAMIKAENISFSPEGIKMRVKFPAGHIQIISPLLGMPNAYNILAAVASAIFMKIPLSHIKQGIHSLTGVPGRFQRVKNSLKLNIFVDYAHTDDALKNLLETINLINSKKTILVFGAGGDRDRSKRARMGEHAGRLADMTIITSDNPRTEDQKRITQDIESGFAETGNSNYEVIPDRKKAISRALEIGQSGDYVLIAGKGHESYQIFKNETIHFDDVETIQEILQSKEGSSL